MLKGGLQGGYSKLKNFAAAVFCPENNTFFIVPPDSFRIFVFVLVPFLSAQKCLNIVLFVAKIVILSLKYLLSIKRKNWDGSQKREANIVPHVARISMPLYKTYIALQKDTIIQKIIQKWRFVQFYFKGKVCPSSICPDGLWDRWCYRIEE